MPDALESVEVASRADLRAWLSANHAQAESIWLVTFKKSQGEKYLPYDAIVEEALCFGWIDSRSRKVDEARTSLLLSPRKAGSNWSASNKARVARLEAAELIEPPGRAAIERAKADGTWTALDDVENLVEPDDLRRALDATPGARTNWDAFPKSAKRGILEWILSAKRETTRAKRVAETASQAGEGRRANQWPSA